VGGAQGVFEALSSYVDVYFEREIEGDLWDWWCLCCGGQIFSATAEIDLLGQLVDLHVASHEKLELRRHEGLQVNMRAIEAYYRFWMMGTLCIKLGMMAFAERLSTIHARDSWGGALQFFNECWRVGLGHVFGQELNRKGGETYMKAVNLLELFLVHGDEPEGAVRALIGDVAKVVEQNRQVAIGLIWPASGYSLAEVSALAAERIGDDELAERYASFVVEHYSGWNEVTRITGRLVLARVQQRRGRRAAAVGHFQHAASDALGAHHVLMALRAGLECGGSEGAEMVERAVAASGRPRDLLLQEYAAACGPSVVQCWQLDVEASMSCA
jgi:hypothetical protein